MQVTIYYNPDLYCVFARVALGQMDSRMPYPGFAFEAVM